SQTVAHYWLPPRLVAYRAAHPAIAIAVEMGNSEQVRAWVRDGAVDCGLIEDEAADGDLTCTAVAEDELIVVCAPALQPRGRGMAERLKSLPWVFRESGSGTRAIFETALAGLGLAVADLSLTLELPSNEAVLSAVLAGGGAAALSRLVAGPLVKDGRLRQLQMVGPKRRFYLIRSPARTVSRAEEALHQLLLTMRKR
ncbi:MAG: LysR substrate-binding domain-containing protein, partial [Rhizomicrobium sp.]